MKQLLIQMREIFARGRDYRCNVWIGSKHAEIYVRRTQRYIDGGFKQTLDLANVQIAPKYQGKGWFTKIVNICLQEAPVDYIYIESVMTERFAAYLRRMGWKERAPESTCFYLPVTKHKHD